MAVIAMGYGIGYAKAQMVPGTVQVTTQSVPDRLQLTARPVPDSVPVKRHPVKRSHLEAGLSYQSDDVYLGRKDSARLPYYIPAISYYHKSGLYAGASLDYLKTSTVNRVDLFTLEAGYMFTAKKYDGVFTVSKYFYNSQSTSITSDIKSSIAYQNGYDLGPIKPGFTFTLNIGDKVDYEGRLEISHTFSLNEGQFDFTPTISAAGSTLNYYDYYRKRRYSIKKKKKVEQTGIATVTGSVVHASTFKLLDYEPTMPIEYSLGKFTLNFTPAYSIPVNPAIISIHTARDNGTTIDKTNTEKIGNTFYFTLGASFLF
jgi:hypothetical protein